MLHSTPIPFRTNIYNLKLEEGGKEVNTRTMMVAETKVGRCDKHNDYIAKSQRQSMKRVD